MPTTPTARSRAIDALHEALTHNGLVMPRSATAALVNDLLTAVADEYDQTIAQLTKARLEHNDQIGKLVRIAELHNVGQFTDAEPIIEELKARRV